MAPVWLSMARRLHRIGLLGVTSWRETLRLTLGEEARAVRQFRRGAEHLMVSMSGSANRWVGDIHPRRRNHLPGTEFDRDGRPLR